MLPIINLLSLSLVLFWISTIIIYFSGGGAAPQSTWVEPMCPAVKVQSLNHWTARRVPTIITFHSLFILETRINLANMIVSSSGLQQEDLESREVQ